MSRYCRQFRTPEWSELDLIQPLGNGPPQTISAQMADFLTPIKSNSISQVASYKLTPSHSPSLKSPLRSPTRFAPTPSPLTLQAVIGATTCSPNGFTAHDASRTVAYCAGSAVVLAQLDEEHNVTQRFYKAKPTAPAINPTVSYYDSPQAPSTPERRRKSLAPQRLGQQNYSPATSPSRDWNDSAGSKTWTSRERTKAVTALSISPDGNYLAVGEVRPAPPTCWSMD